MSADRDAVLEEAALFAEFYAEERMQQAVDATLLDPVVLGPGAADPGEVLMIERCAHIAAYEAAKHIAETLRSMKGAK